MHRRCVLLCSTALALSLAGPQAVLAQDAPREGTVLDTINVFGELWSKLTSIVTDSPADTGTTTMGPEGLVTRGDGSGDANAALTSLPTVQVEGTTSSDAGQNGDNVLNLRPAELSISGGRTSDNTILVNGMSVGSLTGNEDPLGATPLDRVTGTPSLYATYGLHSQTVFVPESFVGSVSVIDSNASAQYGGFQGGVVKYDLVKPSREASGKAEFSFQNDSMTSYHMETDDGLNPLGRTKPDWNKVNASVVTTQPVGERSALVFGLSNRSAEARKGMDVQYRAGTVENRTRDTGAMLGFEHELLNGDSLYLGANLTDYRQEWTSNWAEGMSIDTITKGRAVQARYEHRLEDRAVGGVAFSNMKVTLDASLQSNRTENDASANRADLWYGSYYRDGYRTTAFDEWCDSSLPQSGTTTGIACRTGAFGDRSYADERARVEAKIEGDVARGTFRLGAAIERQRAERSGEGFVYNSAATRLTSGTVVCPTGSDDCIDTQYFSTRIVQNPYDVDVAANRYEGFAETEQTWGRFNLRAGLRADYNSYLENLDIAPRVVGTWAVNDRLTLSVGANRYYSDEYMTFAIHDAIPRGLNQRRTAPGGVVGNWTTSLDLAQYTYSDSDLKTPYTDELTLAAAWSEDWTGGTWRARFVDRKGRDQFASERGASTVERVLTNQGSSKYHAFTLEYDKVWAASEGTALDYVGLNLSAVYAKRKVSTNTYYGTAAGTPDEFIWYENRSYTRSEFNEVTGNLDIPVKAGVELRGSWKDGAYKAGISANVTFGYDGARDTGTESTRVNPTAGSQTHLLYEAYSFDTVATLNLAASARIGEVAGNAVDLTVRVSNLLDETGNRTGTFANPWVPGRALWLGTAITW